MFDEVAPTYMGIYGMTYDQFWRDDPWIAKYYREAYVARRKAENQRDWLLGAYFYDAVSVALANGFRKKGSQPQPYREEPFPIFPPTKEEIEEANRKEKEKIEAVYRSILRKQRAEKAAKENTQNAET